tara:strand:+ start:229 stop:1143 length:915 start_codon:yes stop_codon:yes gene_type:complete
MTKILRPTLCLCLLALVSCNDTDKAAVSKGSGKPQVQVSNYPLQYFAQRIGGDLIEVKFGAPGDGDPAFWEPGDDDVAAFQDADLILLNGATYEKWRDHVSLPESVVVDTSAALGDQLIEIKEAATHSHGNEGEHSHAGIAFTTWMDFGQAKLQAKAVLEALQGILPSEDETLSENYSALLADLVKLEGTMKLAAEGIGETPLFASHPVYQYWARGYDLKVEEVLWEPEVVPTEDQLTELSHLRDFHEAGWMIWEGEPAAESVSKLEEMGIKSVVYDPCGNVPDSGDWLSVMYQNLENLAAIVP